MNTSNWKMPAVVLGGLVLVCAVAQTTVAAQPKNIIFFIGDGMGPEQVKAANYYNGGALSFESFPNTGFLTTYSADASVTGSASAATALATGVKVNTGVVSIATPGDGSDLPTMLEYFQAQNKSVGLVTTTDMTHATPAAFGAHVPARHLYGDIASDYLNETKPNILFGGGGYGMDSVAATNAGYTVVTSLTDMNDVTDNGTSVPMVSGQFGSTHLPYEYDESFGSLPHLSDMTAKALSLLDNDSDGFFLMVEGGKIDHAGHMVAISSEDKNLKTNRNIAETLEFAASVQAAIDWSAGRTDTLILVTADHETGGLTVNTDNGEGIMPGVSWISGVGHTSVNVPVYAWGPNADMISGTMDNTDMFEVTTIPEPGTMSLLAIGGLGLLMKRRRRHA
jgi:alkaline phosphatase